MAAVDVRPIVRLSRVAVLRPPAEEVVNTITHAIGLVLSVVGAVVLLRWVVELGEAWRYASGGLYTASLIGVYTCSTLSHGVVEPQRKRWFRQLDQAFIYLLIVATFTPFVLAYLRSSSGWMLFLLLLWTIALGGFLSKILLAHRVDAISIWLYLILGWLPVMSAGALLGVVPGVVLSLILAGGFCYTLGTVFLMNDHRYPQLFHAVWHLLVILGSALHFFAILRVIAPASEQLAS